MFIKARDIKIGMSIKRDSKDVRFKDLEGIIKVDFIEYLGTNKRGEDRIFNDTIIFINKETAETFCVKKNTLVEVI